MKCTWKKTVLFALAAVMALSLAACGQQGGDTPASGAQPAGQSGRETSTPAPSAPESGGNLSAPEDSQSPGDGNVLVVYYSASGHTESVANYIAQAAGGDLFALTPAEPYTDGDLNWTDENSWVVYEYENPDARDTELTTDTPENWEDYDVVFVGYPIWWYDAAWPVDGFVEANDFTGKTVVPFCTSSSSGLGESGQRLSALAGTGTWLEGQRFRGGASQADVSAWVESLGLV